MNKEPVPKDLKSVPTENRVSCVLPTYNEKENIGRLIDELVRHIDRDLELVVVDDNSPDGTGTLVAEKSRLDSRIRLINRMDTRGLTSAIWDGIQASTGNIIVWMDVDLSMPPAKIPELIQKVEEGYDIAVGSRFVKGGGSKGRSADGGPDTLWGILKRLKNSEDSILAVVLSRMLNVFIRLCLDRSFKDYTSGFIACRREVFDRIHLRGDYGEYFIDLIYRALKMGLRVVEVPYVCLPREFGVSKTGTGWTDYLRRGIKYIRVTLWLKWRLRSSSLPHDGAGRGQSWQH